MPRTDQINITMPDPALIKRLQRGCAHTGMSRSELVRRAIVVYLDSLAFDAPHRSPAPTPPAAAKHDDESYGW
jgi:Ribbon-helix-helix protein, copG family